MIALLSLALLHAPVSEPTPIARVDAMVTGEVRAGFSGVVLVAHGDVDGADWASHVSRAIRKIMDPPR